MRSKMTQGSTITIIGSDRAHFVIAHRLQDWIVTTYDSSNLKTPNWYVIDVSKHDHDVGYPGDLICGPHLTKFEAYVGMAKALIENL